MTRMLTAPHLIATRGMTMIELLIVMAVMGILMATAVPGYQGYMLRVHRTEAIRMLLQASMCQERIYAAKGSYDTGQCQPVSEYKRYQITYAPADSLGRSYVAHATPAGAQLSDHCGSLSINQNGVRGVTGEKSSVTKCWGGR